MPGLSTVASIHRALAAAFVALVLVEFFFAGLVAFGETTSYAHRDLGRTVCLKVLDKQKTATFEARFRGLKRPTEGAIGVGLRHKNVVQTYEYGLTTEGEQYLVMELIDGMGLNFLIETGSVAHNDLAVE